MLQVDSKQSYLNLKIGLPFGTKSGVFRYMALQVLKKLMVENQPAKSYSIGRNHVNSRSCKTILQVIYLLDPA